MKMVRNIPLLYNNPSNPGFVRGLLLVPGSFSVEMLWLSLTTVPAVILKVIFEKKMVGLPDDSSEKS